MNTNDEHPNSETMRSKIRRVVVVMIENRGFDSVLGYLYRPGDEPRRQIPGPRPGLPAFDGLAYVDPESLANPLTIEGAPPLRITPAAGVRATNTPGHNPHEDYRHVNVQLYGDAANPAPGATPAMKGFAQDYSTRFGRPGPGEVPAIQQILRSYASADLPVLSGLARGFAVSDRWFSSVPTQTNANRAFSLAGTSVGRVDNREPLANDRFDTDTIWHVLERAQMRDWAIFYHDPFPPFGGLPYTRGIFPRLESIAGIGARFHTVDRFFDLAEAGKLPAFSYIEPRWGGDLHGLPIKGNDYHPPSDLGPGEALLRRIYQSLRKDPAAWAETLLVITCDEHGGTYDHIPPPWGARPPWGDQDPPFERQYDFGFDRFGVRVPTILVSPWVDAGAVFRAAGDVPYDHTSVIATILEWQGIARAEWGLGERVAHAPSFAAVLDRTSARIDDPLAPPAPPPIGAPLRYGAPFCLRHQSGDYVIGAEAGLRYWFPRVGREGRVLLDCRLGEGPVESGATVQIRTAEELEDRWGLPNFLGAFTDQSTCYWYYSDDSKDYAAQRWQIRAVDRTSGPVCYGDRVSLYSLAAETAGQRLTRSGPWLGRDANAADAWVIEPPPAASEDPDVIKIGDACTIQHMSGDYISTAELGRYPWPRLAPGGAVELHLLGGGGDVVDGGAVRLRSSEGILGARSVLGAFADSHDCYYWDDGYDAAKQSWILTRVSPRPGDARLRYGDRLLLTNMAYRQRLARDAGSPGFITTSGESEWWVLSRPAARPRPAVIRFGERVRLRAEDGRSIIAVERGRYLWPRLGNTGAIALELRGGVGELTDGAVITLRTTEEGLADQTVLGAFADSPNCYYWRDGYDAKKQSWKVVAETVGDGKIRHGDRFSLVNVSYQQALVRDGDYVTTRAGGAERWSFEAG